MNHSIFKTLHAVLAIGILSSPLIADNRKDGAYLRDITRNFETPHLNWGKPLAGGPIKVLFITPRMLAAREVAELAQRIDVEYEAVVVATSSALAVDNVYEAGVLGTSAFEKSQELNRKVGMPYDVIVIANVDFSILPAEAQFKILRQVSEGAGLVMTYPSTGFPYPKVFETPSDEAHAITNMVDASALLGDAAKEDPQHLLKTYAFKQGRIATLNYAPRGIWLGLTPPETYAPVGWKSRYENSMAMISRTLLWAAGRPLNASLKPLLPKDGFSAGKEQALRLISSGMPQGTAQLRLRDTWNTVLWTKDITVNGEESLEALMPPLAAGTHYLDIGIKESDTVVGFGVFRFDVRAPWGGLAISANRESYEQGEDVDVLIKLGAPLDSDAEVSIRLEDLPERKVWKQQTIALPKGEREISVTLKTPDVPTIAALLVAELKVNALEVGKEHQVIFFPRREIELFPMIVWDCIPPFLSEMYAEQIRLSLNDPAGLSHPTEKGEAGRRSALFNQRFVSYTTRICLAAGENGQTLSERWLGMTDEEAEEATGGDGSFNNPAVRAFWKKSVERRLEGLPEIGPMIYTLGDENHFSYEAGYSASDNEAFPGFLKELYGDINALNTAWGSDYSSFEAIGHPTQRELREKEMYPAWYAHRRFMEKQYADVHHYLAKIIKEIDPKARVGAEGSMPGDLELTVEGLDFWGPYSNPVDDELLRTVAADKLRTVWWNGDDVMGYPLWRPLLKGIINGNSWYTSAIEPLAGLIAVDFALSGFYQEDRKPYVDALEVGPAQVLAETPLKHDGIAILWSQASHSASFMNDRFWKPGDSMVPLLNFLYKEGLNGDLLTTRMVESGALERYKILWLCGASALSEAETKAISSFVQRGGLVIADLNPGILNDSCKPLQKSLIGNLFGTPTLNWQPKLEMRPVAVDHKLRNQKVSFHAEKAYQSPDLPVFSVKESGLGAAVLLNFNLSSALNTASTSLDQFLLTLFEAAGVRPSIKVEGISKEKALVRVRSRHENDIVGILAGIDDLGKEVSITLPHARWVYEVNAGLVSEGATRTVRGKLDVPFKVYSVFPNRQEPPTLKIDTLPLTLGETRQVDLSELSPHGIYRLEIFGPDGNSMRGMRSVFSGGKPGSAGKLRFALTDTPGDYKVTLTDVRTGLASTSDIILKR